MLLNFDVIQKTMKNLDIKWKDTQTGEMRIPNKEEISIVAKDCMLRAFENHDTGMASSGGFQAEVINDVVEIRFVLTQANPLSKLLS